MNYRRILSWIFVVIWMGLIFSQSHKPAAESNKLSKGVTEIIIETVEKISPDTEVDITLNALISSGIDGYKRIGFAFLICLLYAASDEFHQTFIPGRGGQVKDVIIDSCGALVGIGLRFMKGKVKVNVKG